MPNDAFISYSHRADRVLAAATEKALERLARPLFAVRAMEVFRDASDLPASSGLGPALEAQLAASRWFVFFASPAAAQSAYCNDELRWWVRHRGTAQMLLVLSDGSIAWDRRAGDFDWQQTDALPRVLQGCFAAEPLYVDLRALRGQDGLDLSHAGFRSAMLDLAAPIRGVPKNSLDNEDVRRHRQLRRLARGAVAAIALLGLAAGALALVARQQAQLSLARLLAVQARDVVHAQPDLGLLLGVESLQRADTPAGRTAMLDLLLDRPQLLRVMHGVDRATLERQGFRFFGGTRLPSRRPTTPAGEPVRCDGGVETMARHDDGVRAAYGCYAGELRFADAQGLRGGWARFGHQQPVTSVLFVDGGRIVVSGGYDGRILLWHFASGVAMEPALADDELPVLALGLSADGRQLASLHAGGPPKLWNLAMAPRLARALGGTSSPDDALALLPASAMPANGILWQPGAAVRLARPIGVAQTAHPVVGLRADGEPVQRPPSAGDAARSSLAVDRASGLLLHRVVDPEGRSSALHLHDASTALELRLPMPGYPTAVTVRPDRQRLLAAIGRTLWMWSLPDGAVVAGPVELEADAQALLFGPGGAWLAAGLADGRLLPLDPRTARPARESLDAHRGTALSGLRTLAASADGAWLASGGADGRIVLWDTRTWDPHAVLAAHGVAVRPGPIFEGAVAVNLLAFSPEGDRLAADTVGGVALWWRADREWVRRALPVPAGVDDLAFTADGLALVTMSTGDLLRWDLDPASWQRQACAIAGRNLSAPEWGRYLSFASEGESPWLRHFDPVHRATCAQVQP